MRKNLKSLAVIVFGIFVLCLSSLAGINPVAEETIGSGGIHWMPKVNYDQIILTVSGPDGSVINKTFKGSSPYFDLSFFEGKALLDGSYTYELRVVPSYSHKTRKNGKELNIPRKTLTQTGHFTVQGGTIVTAATTAEEPAKPLDVLHYDDVIITGSLCVGFDCQDGESFGFDTIILKEHNLRIYFNDTSYTASYPTNSWRITINDSTNGGASYFSIDDVDDGTSIFKVEAGAPSNSLYVEDYGRVGLGTSTPVVELHIKDSDTPTVRLEQDSSGGWTPQTWDVAGNESNFFVRDATNGSKLPFRIQPSTPSSTLCLKSDGKVGVGTWSPSATLEVETTGEAARFLLDRTDGATGEMNAKNTAIAFGSNSDHPVQVISNDTSRIYIDNDGDVGIGSFNTTTEPTYPLQMSGGAYCTGTAWNPASSRKLKENIHSLSTNDALDAFEKLEPVRFNYKIEKDEEYIGFIAEDVPELLANKNRDSVNPMDVVAVLTQVVKEQQKVVKQQQELVKKQQDTIEDLQQRLEKLEKK